MSKRRIVLLASTFAVIAVAASLTAVYAFAGGGAGSGVPEAASSDVSPAVTGNCRTKQTSVANHDLNSTTSTAFVNVAGATVPFNEGGRAASCIVVQFSSMSFAAASGTALSFVRAVLDGSIVGSPSDTQFSGDDDEDADGRWARTNEAGFLFANVAPGAHTVQIQFRSFDGGAVFLHRGTTAVTHG